MVSEKVNDLAFHFLALNMFLVDFADKGVGANDASSDKHGQMIAIMAQQDRRIKWLEVTLASAGSHECTGVNSVHDDGRMVAPRRVQYRQDHQCT